MVCRSGCRRPCILTCHLCIQSVRMELRMQPTSSKNKKNYMTSFCLWDTRMQHVNLDAAFQDFHASWLHPNIVEHAFGRT